ncbi:MAG: DUF4349 domain-containing protein [Sphingobacteriales bacterium]|nr:DUF4349 domain-containing protein [Sphingobacteriales bacterium]
MKYIHCFAASLLLTIVMSCHNQDKNEDNAKLSSLKETASVPDNGPYATDSTASPQKIDQKRKQDPADNEPASAHTDWDKKIIKNATLQLEIKDGNKFYALLREKVKNLGGYIAQEEQTETAYKLENALVIKIPVDQFDIALLQLSDKVEKVHERKISSQDVTTEFVDTRSRMESKKQVRLQYLDLLKQARNMEDILNVQSAINGIQEEIESAAGRVEYLGHAAAYSTINLTYFQVLNASAAETPTSSFGNRIVHSFKEGGAWLSEFFIGLVAVWPLLLITVLGIIFFKKFRNKPKNA